jgi:hypothetical protein
MGFASSICPVVGRAGFLYLVGRDSWEGDDDVAEDVVAGLRRWRRASYKDE